MFKYDGSTQLTEPSVSVVPDISVSKTANQPVYSSLRDWKVAGRILETRHRQDRSQLENDAPTYFGMNHTLDPRNYFAERTFTQRMNYLILHREMTTSKDRIVIQSIL